MLGDILGMPVWGSSGIGSLVTFGIESAGGEGNIDGTYDGVVSGESVASGIGSFGGGIFGALGGLGKMLGITLGTLLGITLGKLLGKLEISGRVGSMGGVGIVGTVGITPFGITFRDGDKLGMSLGAGGSVNPGGSVGSVGTTLGPPVCRIRVRGCGAASQDPNEGDERVATGVGESSDFCP